MGNENRQKAEIFRYLDPREKPENTKALEEVLGEGHNYRGIHQCQLVIGGDCLITDTPGATAMYNISNELSERGITSVRIRCGEKYDPDTGEVVDADAPLFTDLFERNLRDVHKKLHGTGLEILR